jgi:arabinan endo-1,5-alpha-L-arabinosidase
VRPIAQRHGNTAIEAAFIVRHGRFYYLFVSFDGCCHGVKSTYNIRVGRSVNIDGPYVDRANKPMLDGGGTLVLAGNGRVRGPGHCAVFSDGGRQLLVHHFYDANDRGKPKAQLRQIRWDDDNWPIVGEPLNQPEPATRPTTAPALSAVDNTGNGH